MIMDLHKYLTFFSFFFLENSRYYGYVPGGCMP